MIAAEIAMIMLGWLAFGKILAIVSGEPVKILPYIFGASSMAGLAMHLYHGEKLPLGRLIGTVVLSGFCGSICFMILWGRLGEKDAWFLAGMSIFWGVGGAYTLDAATSWARMWLKKRILRDAKKD